MPIQIFYEIAKITTHFFKLIHAFKVWNFVAILLTHFFYKLY